MEIKRDFLMYFDSEGLLNDLKIIGLRFKNDIKNFLFDDLFIPPFRFVFGVDLVRAQEISLRLFRLFISEPKKCVEIAQEITYHALIELINLKSISRTDIQVQIHITSFPSILSCNFFQIPFQGLRGVNGILVGRTALQKYTRSKVFLCTHQTCPNNRGERCIPPFFNNCKICCSYMQENVRSLDLGEEIICQIISSEAFKSKGRFQCIKVTLKDELATIVNLQLGVEYNFILNYENSEFIVWHVSPKSTRTEILTGLGNLCDLPIPNTIARLYYKTSELCPYSPWAFLGAVSSALGSDILPQSSFLQLKMGLLLSLASQNSDSDPVHLVAIGADAIMVQKLIRSVGVLAERFINYCAGFARMGGDKKRNAQDEIWYEAGAMIMARNGVCNLGDWSKFRKDQCNFVCQTIESGKILLNNVDRNKMDADFVPLKCAIWTYWCHITPSNQDQLQLRTLINVFGVPFLAEDKNELEAMKVAKKIFNSSLEEEEKQSETVLSVGDFKEFISLINSRRLTLTESASKLIHDFFVIIRKDRPEFLPVGAIKTITSLAEAHARLSLRSEITYDDVIGVFYLYNEAISTFSGYPLIISNVPFYNDSEPIFKYIHKKMEKFRNSLEDFLEKHQIL